MHFHPLLSIATVLASFTCAFAQLQTVSFGPFAGMWPWADVPLRGSVESIAFGREQIDDRTDKTITVDLGKYRNVNFSGGRVVVPFTQNNMTVEQKEYDAQGRCIRIQGGMSRMGENKSYNYIETVEYDASGVLLKLVSRTSDSEPVTLTGSTSPMPQGGRTTTLSNADGSPRLTLTYDAAGRLTRIRQGLSKKDTVFEYNDKGCVSRWGVDGDPHSGESFEYRYDDADNWTRQTRFLNSDIVDGKKIARDTTTRQITYLPQDKAAIADGERLAGYYRQAQTPMENFRIITEFELRKDGTGRLIMSSASTVPERAIMSVSRDHPVTWSLQGKTLTLKPIAQPKTDRPAEKMEPIRITVGDNGRLTPPGKQAKPFEKVASTATTRPK